MISILPIRSGYYLVAALLVICVCTDTNAQQSKSSFNVIAFYTAKNDRAHITYVHEANKWFSEISAKYNFHYDSTNNWNNLNSEFLSKYQVVLFLDTRPELPEQRVAFQKYMESGGGWIGFHFAAFALNNSAYPQNWDWYHNTFLGSGEYGSNTWRPTSAILRVEDGKHPVTKNLSSTIQNFSQRMVSLAERLTKESGYKNPAINRLDEFSAWHRSKTTRDLAQRLLSRGMDE